MECIACRGWRAPACFNSLCLVCRCKTKENGAGQWADGVCVTGKSQSPIDVCGATGELDKKEVLSFAAGYDKKHTVKLTPSNNAYLDFSTTDLQLSASNVPKIVGYADNAPTWKLVQAHFHWGRDKNDGSGAICFVARLLQQLG